MPETTTQKMEIILVTETFLEAALKYIILRSRMIVTNQEEHIQDKILNHDL